MSRFTDCFFSLECGTIEDELPTTLSRAVADLHDMGAPSSIFPFVFLVVNSVKAERISASVAVDVLRLVKSFLFRRAICGFEPTGLHAVFKGLWAEAGREELTVDTVKVCISRRTTVPWPNNSDFAYAIENNNLVGRRVAKYAVRKMEQATYGETPIDDFEIEHIFPRTPGGNWEIDAEGQWEKIIDTWGNLVPLTEAMNPSVSNGPYITKKAKYATAVFATPRSIAERYDRWNIETIKERSREISVWALSRWPHHR